MFQESNIPSELFIILARQTSQVIANLLIHTLAYGAEFLPGTFDDGFIYG